MNSGDEKYSVICLDLPGRVLPMPEADAAFTHADLMQAVGKYRGFYNDTAAGAPPPVAGESFIPVIRRRRR